tara:strand:+ start:5740 stop:6324 length:585 start_codon:yes stop_codon:yes gene_type:complete
MKIAFTGSSSTGKTTLAKRLMQHQEFANVVGNFITEDARSLLESFGHKSMDNMSRDELRKFQKCYLDQKIANEKSRDSFLVDRSYVDVAAYWLVRDSYDLPLIEQTDFENKCRDLAASYDLHIQFPFDQIPFISDGYRSKDLDFHRDIAMKIQYLLDKWGCKYISIESPVIEKRIDQVLLILSDYSHDRNSQQR